MKSSVLSKTVFIFKYVIVLYVCLSLYLSFFQKNLQFYPLSHVILNFMIHVRLKYSVRPEHIFTSLFNYILIIFECLSECFLNLKCYQLSYVTLNFIMHILEEMFHFYQKISPLCISITF